MKSSHYNPRGYSRNCFGNNSVSRAHRKRRVLVGIIVSAVLTGCPEKRGADDAEPCDLGQLFIDGQCMFVCSSHKDCNKGHHCAEDRGTCKSNTICPPTDADCDGVAKGDDCDDHDSAVAHPVCGDGLACGREKCDDGDDNGRGYGYCAADCSHVQGCGNGALEGNETCDDGNDTTSDRCPDGPNGTCRAASCGDGFIWNTDGGNEACDDGDAISNGEGSCLADCSGIQSCGDGDVEGTESCDDGQLNADTPNAACRLDCTVRHCGDGIIDNVDGEQCDDGLGNSDAPNKSDADAVCRTDCLPQRCGDGIDDAGEQCDEGAANSENADATCRTDCSKAGCGDGVRDTGEDCDDGDSNSDTLANRCRTSCVDSYCGDGVRDSGEQCDNGETSNADTAVCKSDCTDAECGDGHVHDGVEECDDGNDIDYDECSNDCQTLRVCDSNDETPGQPNDYASTGADTNCDRIDGTEALAFFVAAYGNDRNDGSRDDPFRTIQKGINAADDHPTKKHVYVATGPYADGVTVHDGVSVFGGYIAEPDDPSAFSMRIAPTTSCRSGSNSRPGGGYACTVIDSDTAAGILVEIARTTMHIEGMVIETEDGADGVVGGEHGGSSRGIVIRGVEIGSEYETLFVRYNVIHVGTGGDGADGGEGSAIPGGVGGGGADDHGTLTYSGPCAGVVSFYACPGARGGPNGLGGSGGSAGQDGGTSCTQGGGGGNGGDGNNGGPHPDAAVRAGRQRQGTTDMDGNWHALGGHSGISGRSGGGGGGGGACSVDKGGRGGNGGAGGRAGGGGGGGGGSFGIMILSLPDSPRKLNIADNQVFRNAAGTGGSGANGGTGTGGQSGSPGTTWNNGYSSYTGGTGGNGGNGGDGGAGQGGGGGSSAAVFVSDCTDATITGLSSLTDHLRNVEGLSGSKGANGSGVGGAPHVATDGISQELFTHCP